MATKASHGCFNPRTRHVGITIKPRSPHLNWIMWYIDVKDEYSRSPKLRDRVEDLAVYIGRFSSFRNEGLKHGSYIAFKVEIASTSVNFEYCVALTIPLWLPTQTSDVSLTERQNTSCHQLGNFPAFSSHSYLVHIIVAVFFLA